MKFIRQLINVMRLWKEKTRVRRQVRQHRENLRIIVGAASTQQDGWINTNYPVLDLTDGTTFSVLFAQNRVQVFLAEHVWEHLTPQQAVAACRNCYEALAPGGYLRMAVPDGLNPDPAYIDHVRPGGSGPGSDDHKVLYTYETLLGLLVSAGFETRLLEYFDEGGKFHYSEWLPDGGMITRSSRFDKRNAVRPGAYTSLIVDALKPS